MNIWALPQAQGAEILAAQKQRSGLAGGKCKIENGICTISITGVIDREERVSSWTGLPYAVGQDQIADTLHEAIKNPLVAGILLSFNSPGGVVSGTQELASLIAQYAGQKPMAAYADGLCASAAYWLASATGTIYAPATAQVGSIGVITVLTDYTKANEKLGISPTVIHSGKWKAAGHPDKTLSEEEAAIFQEQLDAIHAIFKREVAQNMGITSPESAWAEGQIFLGEKALELGLVSAIVADRAGAKALLAAKIAKENPMNLQELKAAQPELVAELEAEISGRLEQQYLEARNRAAADTLALVRAIGGAKLADSIEAIAKTGITAGQLEALAPILAKHPTDPVTEAFENSQVLAAITEATGAPLPAGPVGNARSALIADAERRQMEVR